MDRGTQVFDQRRVIGAGESTGALVGAAQERSLKTLRGLHGAQSSPFGGAKHHAVGVDGLDGVSDGENRYDRAHPVSKGGDHPPYLFDRGEWPGGIVDDDELRVTDGGQGKANAVVTFTAALDDGGSTIEQQCSLRHPIRRNSDNHAIDDTRGEQTVDRAFQHGPTHQFDERFGDTRSQAFAAAGRRDDRNRV